MRVLIKPFIFRQGRIERPSTSYTLSFQFDIFSYDFLITRYTGLQFTILMLYNPTWIIQ